MSKTKVVALAAAALVAGLVLGSMTIASAAPSAPATGTPGFGARVGGICRQAGAGFADVVAKLTGKTADDVRAERQSGTSFAQIAAAKGIPSDKVTSSVLDARKTALDAAVKAGRITQAQADAMLANMKSRVTAGVSATGANGCGAGGAGGGCGVGAGRGQGAGRGEGACAAQQ